MHKTNGFTLIELIVVIVILGILAVTAAPKFIDLQTDARLATLKAVKATMHSAVTLIRGKAILQGKDKSASGASITLSDQQQVSLVYGYPAATIDGIGNAIDMSMVQVSNKNTECAEDWCYFQEQEGDIGYFYVIPKSKTQINCSVTYKKDKADAEPAISLNTSGC